MKNKKIYFASDFHLGAPNKTISKEREQKLIKWLDSIKPDCEELYLVGDIFDFWHEWKHVVPKGFVRFMAKICEFTDDGIPVYYFTGNHDIWAYNYLSDELGVEIIRKPIKKKIGDKTFYIAHGDGLGNFDYSFKILKKIFTNKILQWMFARIHPNASMSFGKGWSESRKSYYRKPTFYGEKEWLIQYSKSILKTDDIDYFIYGHRHIPKVFDINEKAKYINLGDWLTNYTYAVYDYDKLELKKLNS